MQRKEAEYQAAVGKARQEAADQIEEITKAHEAEIMIIKHEHAETQKSLEDSISALKTEIASSAGEKEEVWRQKLADIEAASEAETAALKAQLESLESESKKSGEEVEALKATLTALNSDITTKDNDLAELNEQLKKTAEDLAAKSQVRSPNYTIAVMDSH